MTIEAAVRHGDLTDIDDALSAGAAVDQRDAHGFSPLMIAAGLGRARMVRLLLEAGADPHAIEPRMGATALHKAAHAGNAEVIGLLLDHGAFIDQQSPVLGNTPLIDAVLHKHELAVRLLLQRGARTTIRNHWQQSALELADADGSRSLARMIEACDTASARSATRATLIDAVNDGDVDRVQRLLASGVDVEQRNQVTGGDDDDYTPLGIAARANRTAIVTLLIDAGADPRRSTGLMRGTPVHEAAFFGHAATLRVFVAARDRGTIASLELDAQGPYNGLTPLHDAVWHGHLDAVRVLVEAGAPLDIHTHAGLTPGDMATLYGYGDIAQLIASHEAVR